MEKRLALATIETFKDQILHTDAETMLRSLPDHSIDCIISDMPYGTTACAWDSIIPLDMIWAGFKRVIKPRGAIVLTAIQPFTSILVMSNPEMFRYEWIWNKASPVGFLNAKNKPMGQHESILIFSKENPNYFPQYRTGLMGNFGKTGASKSGAYGYAGADKRSCVGFPLSILKFPRPNNLTDGSLHPTQKPVALFEYLIRTYTRPGEIVLDVCMGSGTTAVAARNTKRHYIGCDIMEEYVKLARDRVSGEFGRVAKRERKPEPFAPKVIGDAVQHSLFAPAMSI